MCLSLTLTPPATTAVTSTEDMARPSSGNSPKQPVMVTTTELKTCKSITENRE